MLPTLPRPFVREMRWVVVLFTLCVVSACGGEPPPVAPGPPIAADPPVTLGTMIAECDAMVAALNTYAECSNLDDDTKTDMRAWIKQTEADIAAGRKATIDQGAQGAIALACRRATASVQAATERCHAGRALPYEP